MYIDIYLSRQWNCSSVRCSWSIACRRCANYIFIFDPTPGFNGLGKYNCRMKRETFKFWNIYIYISVPNHNKQNKSPTVWKFLECSVGSCYCGTMLHAKSRITGPHAQLRHSNIGLTTEECQWQRPMCKLTIYVIVWKRFPHYQPFVWGFLRSPMDSNNKGSAMRTLELSPILSMANCWTNSGLWRLVCVQNLRALYDSRGHECRKMTLTYFWLQSRSGILIGMKRELDLRRCLLHVYAKFQIDISKHVEKP